jgi:hypothetical protein
LEIVFIAALIVLTISAPIVRWRYAWINKSEENNGGVRIYGILPIFRIDLDPKNIERILVYEPSARSFLSPRYSAYNCLAAYSYKKGGKAALIRTKDDRPVETNFTNIKSLIEALPANLITDETKPEPVGAGQPDNPPVKL